MISLFIALQIWTHHQCYTLRSSPWPVVLPSTGDVPAIALWELRAVRANIPECLLQRKAQVNTVLAWMLELLLHQLPILMNC